MTNWVIYIDKIANELKTRFPAIRRRRKYLGKVHIKSTGAIVKHGLGITPQEVVITPIEHKRFAPLQAWLYREPDSENIYIRATADGYFIISVAGG